MPHNIDIVSKGGTLSYEAVDSTSLAGLGQSLVIGTGEDTMPGTTLVDGLKLFFVHPETEGITVIREIGGEAELRAAEAIQQYGRPTQSPKPMIVMAAGNTAPKGRTMGYAGAFLDPGGVIAEAKAKTLADSGAIVVPHLGVLGEVMSKLLSSSCK
ncbi:related to succinate-CoA ligase alpha and beta chain [Fusarium proliferatum]|nr:related to succinate-CoA ligase alpha and beta chain [Fusarium proliferatum]